MSNNTHNNEPLFIDGMKDSDYRNAVGLSQSSLKKFMISPAHYLASLEEKEEPTKAMIFGSAYHAHILCKNPENFYAVKEKVDGRSKEGRAYNDKFDAENTGKFIITQEDYEKILKMESALKSHPLANELITQATHKEVALFSSYESPNKTMVRLKGMIDGYNSHNGHIFDLKTAEDASPSGFRKAIWDRKYDIQQIHYQHLLHMNARPIGQFFFIAQEKEPPFAVGVYTITYESLIKASNIWKNQIERFSECQKTGEYPAYSENAIEINL